MYRTTSKRNEQIAWIILFLAVVGIVPGFIRLIVTAVTDDISQYGVFENVLSAVLFTLAVLGVLYFYYMLIAFVLYARAVCSVTELGIEVRYRLPLIKDRLFSWSSIGKILLATTASDKPELEFRCFTTDFNTNGRGFARKYHPESNIWDNAIIAVNHQRRMITIQYCPELMEAIKRYHPDVIPYPNEKIVEGYADCLQKNDR